MYRYSSSALQTLWAFSSFTQWALLRVKACVGFLLLILPVVKSWAKAVYQRKSSKPLLCFFRYDQLFGAVCHLISRQSDRRFEPASIPTLHGTHRWAWQVCPHPFWILNDSPHVNMTSRHSLASFLDGIRFWPSKLSASYVQQPVGDLALLGAFLRIL